MNIRVRPHLAAYIWRRPMRSERGMHVLHTFANNDHVPYLSWFAERARAEGGVRYTFIILYPERPRMLDEMRGLGFNAEWIRYDDRHRKRGMLRALPHLWRLMRRYRPDIVHCHLFDDTLPGLIAARLAGVKVRVTTRQDTGYSWLYAPQWVFADRWNMRLSTHVIAISSECRDFLVQKEGTPAHKVSMVHNGIPPGPFTRQDPAVMARLRERFGLAGRHPVVGTVARFIAWKGHRQIVDAARELVKRHPRALFLFCGGGGDENSVRAMVAEAGLQEHIRFTGWIDRAEIPSFFGVLDVYLHAAEMEPFGLVIAEAMMNAVPVVSTPTGAALDAIEDGVNGVLARREGTALAEGVERVLGTDARAMGAAGRATALRLYPFEVMWRGTMDLYARALGEQA